MNGLWAHGLWGRPAAISQEELDLGSLITGMLLLGRPPEQLLVIKNKLYGVNRGMVFTAGIKHKEYAMAIKDGVKFKDEFVTYQGQRINPLMLDSLRVEGGRSVVRSGLNQDDTEAANVARLQEMASSFLLFEPGQWRFARIRLTLVQWRSALGCMLVMATLAATSAASGASDMSAVWLLAAGAVGVAFASQLAKNTNMQVRSLHPSVSAYGRDAHTLITGELSGFSSGALRDAAAYTRRKAAGEPHGPLSLTRLSTPGEAAVSQALSAHQERPEIPPEADQLQGLSPTLRAAHRGLWAELNELQQTPEPLEPLVLKQSLEWASEAQTISATISEGEALEQIESIRLRARRAAARPHRTGASALTLYLRAQVDDSLTIEDKA